MNSTVLVPYDGSSQAKRALEFALKQHPDGDVLALYVVDTALDEPPERNFLDEDLVGLYERREAQGVELLDEAEATAEKHGRSLTTDVEFGPAHRAIIEYADKNDVDHIVIGSHGRSGAQRILMGSVAEKVARRSSVPVTIAR